MRICIAETRTYDHMRGRWDEKKAYEDHSGGDTFYTVTEETGTMYPSDLGSCTSRDYDTMRKALDDLEEPVSVDILNGSATASDVMEAADA